MSIYTFKEDNNFETHIKYMKLLELFKKYPNY